MQAGKTPPAGASASTLARTQPPDGKGGKPAQAPPKAAPPRRQLFFYKFKNKTLQLLAAVLPGVKRLPVQPVQQPKPDAGIPVYDQWIQRPDGQLTSLMGEALSYLGTPQQLREQLAWMEGRSPVDQSTQCRFDQLPPAFARVTEDQVKLMLPGAQLMLGPSDGDGPDDLFSPAVYLGESGMDDIMVRSAFKGGLFQSCENRDSVGLEDIRTRTSPDGWGYVVFIPSEVGVYFWAKPDASPRVLDPKELQGLREGTRLLVQIPVAGGAGGRAAARPAIFLGARAAGDGRVMLNARAPWAPAHEDPGGEVSHGQTAILTRIAGPSTQMRTRGEVPQPGDYAIGPGPAKPSPDMSEGWFEWEAALPAGTVVVLDPYFGSVPDLGSGLKPGAGAAQSAAEDEWPQPVQTGSGASSASSSAGSTQSGMLGLDGEPDVQDTKRPAPVSSSADPAAPAGGLTHKQFVNMGHVNIPVQVTDGQGRTVLGEFVGVADSQTQAPNAVWVVAARGALTDALEAVPVPNEPANFSYLVSLSTHRVELAQA